MMQFLRSILSLKQDNADLHRRLAALEGEVQATKKLQAEHTKTIAQIAANLVVITDEFTTIVSNLKVILHSVPIEEDYKLVAPEDKKYVN
jgi:K+/H+ antiporter YhaU regulatory subunit KhtT